MRFKLVPAALVVAFIGAVALPGIATAGGGYDTHVNIKEAAPGDFHGVVKSEKQKVCAKGRKVTLYKQKGHDQKPSKDEKIHSDTASLSGGKYRWDTGNTGTKGKVYARAKKTDQCDADNSKTIKSSK
ncbi:MAG: hypothetical protein ABI726_06975 [bacterium]